MEKITTEQLINILKSPDTTAADISLIRYYTTENELVVMMRYRTIDLKCVIDKLSLIDGEIPNANTIEGFILTYLAPPLPVLKVEMEKYEQPKINIQVSQVP